MEEAVHLLRNATAAHWLCYLMGALPFALGVLYFWSDMSHSGFAWQHETYAALGMTAGFIWLKCWQCAFVCQLRARLSGQVDVVWDPKRVGRLVSTQTVIHATGLFILPIAAVLTLPFAWVFSFYQNASYTADGTSGELKPLISRTAALTRPWAAQNHAVLGTLSLATVFVLLNWVSAFVAIPMLAKSLLGMESAFTLSSAAYLNTTFFAVIALLTWLTLDPLIKAVYLLRCFHAEAVTNGADLLAELHRLHPGNANSAHNHGRGQRV